MNISLSANEITVLADQLLTRILPHFHEAIKQASKAPNPSLAQLTVEEVAEQLKFSEKTIHKFLKMGPLHAKNLGTSEKPQWRISQKAVDDFLVS